MEWNVDASISPKEAIALQKKLREQVRIQPLPMAIDDIRHIGGADVSMSMFAKDGYAGFVTLSYPDLVPIGESVIAKRIGFPYIPGLLSFREIPMLLDAWNNLRKKPDVIIVDGVGIAHPRRLGIASHLGIILGIPTIGCAKSVLIGEYDEPADEPGAFSYMYDKKRMAPGSGDPAANHGRGEIIGAALRTKKGVKPVFISPGHLITLEESIEIVRSCIRKHRLPEPTRIAHNTMNEYRIRAESNTDPKTDPLF